MDMPIKCVKVGLFKVKYESNIYQGKQIANLAATRLLWW